MGTPPSDAPSWNSIFAKLATLSAWVPLYVALWSSTAVILLSLWSIFFSPQRLIAIKFAGQPPSSYAFNDELLSYAIRDRANSMFEQAKIDPNSGMRLDIGEAEVIKVDLPEQKFSIEQVTEFLRGAFGLTPRRIFGNIAAVEQDNSLARKDGRSKGQFYRLTLRKADQIASLYDATGRLETLIDGAALALVEDAAPIVAANYLRTSGSSTLPDAISRAQRAASRFTSKGPADRSLTTQARDALLVLGYALGEDGQLAESDAAFDRLIPRGNKNDQGQAYDGKAYVRIEAARRERGDSEKKSLLNQAKLNLIAALAARQNYDSAVFHQGEVAAVSAQGAISAKRPDEALMQVKEASNFFDQVTGLSQTLP